MLMRKALIFCKVNLKSSHGDGGKKATGDDVPGDVLKLLAEDGLRKMTQMINNICETGDWLNDFTEITMITLKKKPVITKFSDHYTVSLIPHKVKIVVRIL
jgi:hypothetical protein